MIDLSTVGIWIAAAIAALTLIAEKRVRGALFQLNLFTWIALAFILIGAVVGGFAIQDEKSDARLASEKLDLANQQIGDLNSDVKSLSRRVEELNSENVQLLKEMLVLQSAASQTIQSVSVNLSVQNIETDPNTGLFLEDEKFDSLPQVYSLLTRLGGDEKKLQNNKTFVLTISLSYSNNFSLTFVGIGTENFGDRSDSER